VSVACFSNSYTEARQRFVTAVSSVGGHLYSYPIPVAGESNLYIDVAVIGASAGNAVVVSSGVHGIEGFFGSAVQLAMLQGMKTGVGGQNLKYVLIHAINPFGFAQLRRFNENNVDLNRNFIDSKESYSGAPAGYARLNRFLNPESAPSRFEPFRMRALWNIWRSGMPALKESVASGQYEYPRGIFFGGREICRSTELVQQHCAEWLGESKKIFHIDLHTGLGPYGSVKLLLNEADNYRKQFYTDLFGAKQVEAMEADNGTAYKVAGHFGGWIQNRFSTRDYFFVGAEYGTYNIVRVLQAVRAENRAHHYASVDSSCYRAARQELMECFCPEDEKWRYRVMESALDVIDRAGNSIRPAASQSPAAS